MARVLVVDDDPGVRQTLALALRDGNVEVEAVRNGREALVALSKATAQGKMYDAMVLDILMPGIDGWQVLEAVKSNPLWHGLPVIVLSGVANSAADLVRMSDYDSVFVAKDGNFLSAVRTVLIRLLDAA